MELRKIIQSTIIFSAIAISGLFVSCNGQTAAKPGRVNETISVTDFSNKLSQPSVQLVDVRTPEEYSEGHLKGAVNANVGADDFASKVRGMDKNKPVLVYCLSGGRSARAANMLSEMGFTEVYNMDGGILRWNAAGLPVETGSEVRSHGMSMAEFIEHVKSEKYVLVDFNAQWCVPCRQMKPMLDAFAEKRADKMILYMVDADENKDLLMQKGIDGIPYLELYKNGQLVWKHHGSISEADLINQTKL